MTGVQTCALPIYILQLPFHHPVLLAEQLAVIDIMSNGRLFVGLGPGAFDMEFEMLGVDPKQRPSRVEEGVEIMLRAWTEDEPFSFHGKRWQLENIWINPKPVQKPRPPVFVSAPFSDAAMERAIRLGVDVGAVGGGFFFTLTDRDAWTDWRERWGAMCERRGVDPGTAKVSTFGSGFVTDDPERAWAEYREGSLYHVNYERQGIRPYQVMFGNLPLDEPEQLPHWQRLFVTPEQAVEEIRAAYADGAPDELHLMARRPGMSWQQSAEFMQTFAEKVLPHVRDLGRAPDDSAAASTAS